MKKNIPTDAQLGFKENGSTEVKSAFRRYLENAATPGLETRGSISKRTRLKTKKAFPSGKPGKDHPVQMSFDFESEPPLVTSYPRAKVS